MEQKKGFLNKFLNVSFQPRYNRAGELVKIYKVVKILFFKIKFSYPPVFGKNNKIFVVENSLKRELSINELKDNIKIQGDNNTVILPSLNKLINCEFSIVGNNNSIKILQTKYLINGLVVSCSSDGACLNIEEDFSTGPIEIIIKEGVKNISIGKDCMFSSKTIIQSSDGHKIYYLATNECINKPKDIIIGDHVWVGRDVKILKNSKIQAGTIIGANSLVNKEFDEGNCVIAGAPAKIVKKGIRWER